MRLRTGNLSYHCRGRAQCLIGHRDLAANIGIKFLTPEEFFLNEATEPYDHVFEPVRYIQSATESTLDCKTD